MPTVFDTPGGWSAATFFKKNTIILDNGLYYYATVDHTSTADFSGDVNTRYFWDGIGLDSQNRQLARFFWRLSYGSPVQIQPKVNTTQFGDSYAQRTQEGINSTLLAFDVGINGMDEQMCLAVSHFLYTKQGATSFYWIPFFPFSILKRFTCRDWSVTPEFYNNYSLRARFEETAF